MFVKNILWIRDFFFRRRRTKTLYKLIFKTNPEPLIWDDDDDVYYPERYYPVEQVKTEALNFVTIQNCDTFPYETFVIHCKVK